MRRNRATKVTKSKESKVKATNEFSFDDLQKELKKIAPLGSTMDVSTFSEVSEYISTGNYILNACLTGSVFKGYPNNRSVCLAGPSGVGKTFLMLNAAAAAQRMGYYVAWYDSENAVDRELMEKFGLDTSKVWYEPCNTVEEFRTSTTNLTQRLIDAQRAGKTVPKVIAFLDSAGNLASAKEVSDAASGSDKADMTRAKKFKSIFRILMTKMAEVKIPLIFSNHVYNTQDFISQIKAGGGTGPEYAASIILILTKAKIGEKTKDDKGKKVTKQVGIVITAKPNKNRFAKPNAVKVHLRYDKGMNPYIGLEQFLGWDACGIGKGSIVDAATYKKLKDDKKKKSVEYADEATGEIFYYLPDDKAKTIAVKHLNREVSAAEFYSENTFSDEVLQQIDEVIKPIFNYGIDEELPDDELFDGSVDDDNDDSDED